jgi:hypothetical protein
MGIPAAVLRAWHIMVGRDMHIPWPPGSPAPAPAPVPYITTAPMIGILPMVTSKCTATVFADSLCSMMVRGTDIGPMIPHVGPPSTTLPIEMLTSGSKSHFGITKWKVKDQTGAPGCVAVAMLGVVNPNLNCGTPVPLPMGFVIAPTTHLASMTLGDAISGLCMMGWDFVIQGSLYYFGKKVLDPAAKKLVDYVAGRLGVGALSRVAARQLARALGTRSNIGPAANALRAQRLAALAKAADNTSLAAGLALGSPLGISTSTASDSTKSAYDRAMDAFKPQERTDNFGQAVDDYFASPSSTVTDVPSVPDHVAGDGGGPDATTAPDAGAASDEGGAGDLGGAGSGPSMSSADQGESPNMSSMDDGDATDPSAESSTGGEPNACTPEPGSDDGNSSR